MSACLVGKDWCDFLWSTWKLEWIYLWICSMLFSGVYDANSRRSYRCGHFKCLICLLFIVKMLYVVVGSGPGLVDGRVVVWSSALLASTLYFHVHCCPLRHGWIGERGMIGFAELSGVGWLLAVGSGWSLLGGWYCWWVWIKHNVKKLFDALRTVSSNQFIIQDMGAWLVRRDAGLELGVCCLVLSRRKCAGCGDWCIDDYVNWLV